MSEQLGMREYVFFPRNFATGGFTNPQTAVGTFTTGNLCVEGFSLADFTLDVTAVTGTSPTLDVLIQEFDFISGKYVAILTFTTKTTTVTDRQTVNPLFSRYIRMQWTVGGTSPSFTFTLGAKFK